MEGVCARTGALVNACLCVYVDERTRAHTLMEKCMTTMNLSASASCIIVNIGSNTVHSISLCHQEALLTPFACEFGVWHIAATQHQTVCYTHTHLSYIKIFAYALSSNEYYSQIFSFQCHFKRPLCVYSFHSEFSKHKIIATNSTKLSKQ